MRAPYLVVLAAALTALLVNCAAPDQGGAEMESGSTMQKFQAIESESVPRLLKLSERIYCGAEPKLEASFEALQALGIRTIVSVDGADPNLEWAGQYGMQYVHIPIGYDGIEADQAASMVAVMRTRPGPFYFHCHHGRHRGPAAAAIALMADTECGPAGGLAVLKQAGTSEKYTGLWRDIRGFENPPADAKLPQLRQQAVISDFNAAMAEMDRTFDELKLIQADGWLSSASHPDLDSHQSALILAQHFQKLGDPEDPEIATESLFQEQLQKATGASLKLEQALKTGDAVQADLYLKAVKASCTACHTDYRNT
jgi:protein tyrosine phosphatase (PTP) superfamily phosphohydrolase (DUF442 family)